MGKGGVSTVKGIRGTWGCFLQMPSEFCKMQGSNQKFVCGALTGVKNTAFFTEDYSLSEQLAMQKRLKFQVRIRRFASKFTSLKGAFGLGLRFASAETKPCITHSSTLTVKRVDC